MATRKVVVTCVSIEERDMNIEYYKAEGTKVVVDKKNPLKLILHVTI